LQQFLCFYSVVLSLADSKISLRHFYAILACGCIEIYEFLFQILKIKTAYMWITNRSQKKAIASERRKRKITSSAYRVLNIWCNFPNIEYVPYYEAFSMINQVFLFTA